METGSGRGTAADVEAVMKKYDRESNTRVWEGVPKTSSRVLMSVFSVYCILMTLFSKALPERRLIPVPRLHHDHRLSGVSRIRKGAARVNHVPWYDWILMALGAGRFFYFRSSTPLPSFMLATSVTKAHSWSSAPSGFWR